MNKITIDFYHRGINKWGRPRTFMACCDEPEGAWHSKDCPQYGAVRSDTQWWIDQVKEHGEIQGRMVDDPGRLHKTALQKALSYLL